MEYIIIVAWNMIMAKKHVYKVELIMDDFISHLMVI